MANNKIELIPPHNIEMEKALLGSIFISSEALDDVIDIIYSDDFYLVTHQNLFQEIINFSREYQAVNIDYISFKAYLEKKGSLEKCGGEEILYSFASGDFISSNVGIYAQGIIENSTRRRLLNLGQSIKEGAYDLTKNTQDVVNDIEQQFTKISQRGISGATNYQVGSSLITDVVDTIIEGRQEDSVTTGFTTLDSMTGGFRGGEMIIIGARPGIGKTAFALSMMTNMLRSKYKVGFFSLEMSAEQILKRIFSNVSNIPFKRIRNNRLLKDTKGQGSSEEAKLFNAAEELSETDFYIQDIPNMRLLDVRSQARKMKREHQIDILILDYIGLVSVEANANVPRHEQIAFVSRSMKQLARELDIPVIMLSQVTRDVENAEPNLSSLRESGAIEQDADAVMFLHRERIKDIENRDPIQSTKLILAKQRSGETGTFKIGFQGELVRFVNAENPYGD